MFFAKWIVVPAALGVAGFYMLGPRLGDEVFKRKPEVSAPDESPVPTDPTATPEKTDFPKPNVDINAGPMTSSTEEPKPKHRRRRRRPAARPSPSAAPDASPPADSPPPAQDSPPPAGKSDGNG